MTNPQLRMDYKKTNRHLAFISSLPPTTRLCATFVPIRVVGKCSPRIEYIGKLYNKKTSISIAKNAPFTIFFQTNKAFYKKPRYT
jgi:hypothetical protein